MTFSPMTGLTSLGITKWSFSGCVVGQAETKFVIRSNFSAATVGQPRFGHHCLSLSRSTAYQKQGSSI